MKKRNLTAFITAVIMLLSLFTTIHAATWDPYVTETNDRTYKLNEYAEEIGVSIKNVATAKWQWYRNGQAIDGASGEGTYAAVIPDTSELGESYYHVVFSVGSGMETASSKEIKITVIEPDYINFSVWKTDEANQPLEGAEFALFEMNYTTSAIVGEVLYEAVSDKNGEAKFEKVIDGSYWLVENVAPEGYIKSEERYYISIFEGEMVIVTDSDELPYEDITFVNKRDPQAPSATATPTPYPKGTNATPTPDPKGTNATPTPDPNGTNATPTPNPNDVTSSPTPTEKPDGTEATPTPAPDSTETPATPAPTEEPALNKEDHFAFISGYPDGTFGQTRPMTRAEVTVMFSRLLAEQMETDGYYPNSFSDVPADKWYANQIGYMEKFKIVNGYKDGTFKPDAPITRAEFTAIASRFDELSEGSIKFSDVPSSHWAIGYISSAAEKGWVGGYPDGTFRPDANITRAEVVTVVCRMLERNADRNYIDANMTALPRTFKDVSTADWAFDYVMESANGHNYTKESDKETWTNTYE